MLSYDMKKLFKNKIITIVTFVVLIVLGFTYLTPLFYALSNSFKDLADIINPFVTWIPTNPTLENYQKLLTTGIVGTSKTLLYTIFYVTTASVLQTISCAIVGYGFANYNFRFKKVFMALLLAIFILPDQVLMTPTYVLFGKLGLTNTLFAFFVPAALAQGLNSSIFILIFYAFFSAIPKDIYESAKMEGATNFVIFRKIIVPLVQGAINITFVLSFVWYWNETYLASVFYQSMPSYTLTIYGRLTTILSTVVDTQMNMQEFPVYDGLKAATIVLLVIPLLIFYFIFQRRFTQSIENSGITGQ